MSPTALDAFAAEVGAEGPVAVVGGRTQWDVGAVEDRAADFAEVRELRAPAGVVDHQPEEMIVRVRAGTPVAELDTVLAERGQMVPLDPDDPERATVGGVLAVGRSGLRRLRWGPARDTVLEIRYVSAEGRLVKAGGPVVKNVTGFDLCRLLVGSLGTLGLLAEVVLRVQPRPAVARWLRSPGGVDPFAARAALYRPSSLLWDGTTTWVLLEGHGPDVDAEAARLGPGWVQVEGPPRRPGSGRTSIDPAGLPELRDLAGRSEPFLAEIGVGIVYGPRSAAAPVEPSTLDLNRRVKAMFDPSNRLNPGRRVVA